MRRACGEALLPMTARMVQGYIPDDLVHRTRTTARHGAVRASDALRRRPCARPSGPRPRRRASSVVDGALASPGDTSAPQVGRGDRS